MMLFEYAGEPSVGVNECAEIMADAIDRWLDEPFEYDPSEVNVRDFRRPERPYHGPCPLCGGSGTDRYGGVCPRCKGTGRV